MKKFIDILIIAAINIILFSVFSVAAEKENKLFLEVTNTHIVENTDFKGGK